MSGSSVVLEVSFRCTDSTFIPAVLTKAFSKWDIIFRMFTPYQCVSTTGCAILLNMNISFWWFAVLIWAHMYSGPDNFCLFPWQHIVPAKSKSVSGTGLLRPSWSASALSRFTCRRSHSFLICAALSKPQQKLVCCDIFLQIAAMTMPFLLLTGRNMKCKTMILMMVVRCIPNWCKDCGLSWLLSVVL